MLLLFRVSKIPKIDPALLPHNRLLHYSLPYTQIPLVRAIQKNIAAIPVILLV